MTTSLQRRLETLYGLERRKDKLGLEGTRALLAALGNPHERFRSVHVAGTNGKGSVCVLVERVLRESGHRTGLYTSPHLVDFRERIRVNGRWIDEEWLERALDHIESLPEGRNRTFFEVATALGFLWFADNQVEIAVIEVGLGGRLDCTNVITPEVSVITSIGLDHTEILGDALEKIAYEKAGIIKPEVPVVLADAPPVASAVVRAVAAERDAPVLGPYASTSDLPGWTSNHGAAVLALDALRSRGIPIPPGALERGFGRARWPGRLEACPTRPKLWWDGAHNVDGFRWLGRLWGWSHTRGPARVVLSLSRDKDAAAILGELRLAFRPLHLVLTRSRSERAADPEAIRAEADRRGIPAETAPDVVTAVERALTASGGGEVLLTGSLFAVGEAMEAFGGAPGEQL